MGIEPFLLVFLAVVGVLAALFFTGSFGAAKATSGDEDDDRAPTHVYVENPTKERTFGEDSTDDVRRRAEEDPNTEVRA